MCLRAGAFRSASSQGIKLLVRRNAKALAESPDPLLRSFFAGAKPSEAVERLEQAVFDEERAVLGDTGTDLDALVAAHRVLLDAPQGPFVNVAGRPEHAAAERELRARVERWMRDTADPRVDPKNDAWDKYPYFGGRVVDEQGNPIPKGSKARA